MSEEPRPTRRIVFTGLGALGVAAALAGCGGGTSSGPATGSTQKTTSAGSASEVLAKTSEVPVGGGIILTDQSIVITQPKAGEFEAFSSVCKHQGFPVGKVEDGTITCLQHGTTYDAATGARTGGPAPTGSALDRVKIDVDGDQILAA
jgi:nitrite reductase/ring-hydroxylating ferredoxin subunit